MSTSAQWPFGRPGLRDLDRRPSLAKAATIPCVGRLQRQYREDTPSAVAALSRLRSEIVGDAQGAVDLYGSEWLEDLGSLRIRALPEDDRSDGAGAQESDREAADEAEEDGADGKDGEDGDKAGAEAALAPEHRPESEALAESAESTGSEGRAESAGNTGAGGLTGRREEREREWERRLGARATKHLRLDTPFVRDWHDRREEEAVRLAVSLWALHQQSIREADMFRPGWTLGGAVRKLADPQSGPPRDTGADDAAEPHLNEAIRKRFQRLGTSTSVRQLSVRLREIVQLLRGARIPVDYGRLAEQLHMWQYDSFCADVRRSWGREFHLRLVGDE